MNYQLPNDAVIRQHHQGLHHTAQRQECVHCHKPVALGTGTYIDVYFGVTGRFWGFLTHISCLISSVPRYNREFPTYRNRILMTKHVWAQLPESQQQTPVVIVIGE